MPNGARAPDVGQNVATLRCNTSISPFGHFQGGLWNYQENTLLHLDFSRFVENFRAVLAAFMTRAGVPVTQRASYMRDNALDVPIYGASG